MEQNLTGDAIPYIKAAILYDGTYVAFNASIYAVANSNSSDDALRLTQTALTLYKEMINKRLVKNSTTIDSIVRTALDNYVGPK